MGVDRRSPVSKTAEPIYFLIQTAFDCPIKELADALTLFPSAQQLISKGRSKMKF